MPSPHSVTGKVSLYSFADNDVNGNFGTYATASGINASPDFPTAAVQMNGRDGFKIGDVLLVQKGDRQVIVLATDVGGLPHAQVDIFEGVAAHQLNMELTRNGRVTAVTTVDGTNDPTLNQGYTITRIGHLPDVRSNASYRDANRAPAGKMLELLNTINAINSGQAPASALEAFEQSGMLQNVEIPANLLQRQTSAPATTAPQTPQAQPVSTTQPVAPAIQPAPQQDNGFMGMIMQFIGPLLSNIPIIGPLIGGLLSMFAGGQTQTPQPVAQTPAPPVTPATSPQNPPAPALTTTQLVNQNVQPPLATPAVNRNMNVPQVGN